MHELLELWVNLCSTFPEPASKWIMTPGLKASLRSARELLFTRNPLGWTFSLPPSISKSPKTREREWERSAGKTWVCTDKLCTKQLRRCEWIITRCIHSSAIKLCIRNALFEFANRLASCAQAEAIKAYLIPFIAFPPSLPALFALLVDFYFSREREGMTSSHSIPSQRIIFNGIWLTYDIPLRSCFDSFSLFLFLKNCFRFGSNPFGHIPYGSETPLKERA